MQHSSTPAETTVLEVPPLPRYARVVRMTAANLAVIAGMNVDEVDDVRMAAEEASTYAPRGWTGCCMRSSPSRTTVWLWTSTWATNP